MKYPNLTLEGHHWSFIVEDQTHKTTGPEAVHVYTHILNLKGLCNVFLSYRLRASYTCMDPPQI